MGPGFGSSGVGIRAARMRRDSGLAKSCSARPKRSTQRLSNANGQSPYRQVLAAGICRSAPAILACEKRAARLQRKLRRAGVECNRNIFDGGRHGLPKWRPCPKPRMPCPRCGASSPITSGRGDEADLPCGRSRRQGDAPRSVRSREASFSSLAPARPENPSHGSGPTERPGCQTAVLP